MRATLLSFAISMLFCPAIALAQTRTPILLDTDIGSDVDDAFALALALASPELDLKAITTVAGPADDRAWIVCRFLTHASFGPIPVAFGAPPQPELGVDWQIQYRRHPAPIFNRTQKPAKESAVEVMAATLKASAGKMTLVAIGPLTNVARLLREHRELKDRIERIVLMGGSVRLGYSGKAPPEVEWNIKGDIAAARAVFESGVPLTVVPLDATATVKLSKAERDRLFSAHTRLTFQIQTLYELWDQETPVLYDPVAVAAVFEPGFCDWEDLALSVDDKGMTVIAPGKANARVAVGVRGDEFCRWYVDRVRAIGEASLPTPPKNQSRLVERSRFPARIHVAEDYETDIEKRWWMAGKAETKDVPPGGRRACRGVLTQDFDDRQGQTKTSYRAVIFNPVPGPPMGPNTRLSFKYKLAGADTLRVQLYSLTNGYHRYLSVTGLPHGSWQSGTVDMTQMRRPDGTGGPLGENERIDDIQFYVDPRAEVLIDDVLLYDAATAGEERPFPRRVLFTGGFDTGKPGKEWPGDFDIIPHEKPRAWKAARSVMNNATAEPWIRLSLRGARRLGTINELFFRYRVSGADPIRVELVDSKSGFKTSAAVANARPGEWDHTTLAFPTIGPERTADEIRFLLPRGELLIDDVLLYEPGP